jgi:hypothetical protein
VLDAQFRAILFNTSVTQVNVGAGWLHAGVLHQDAALVAVLIKKLQKSQKLRMIEYLFGSSDCRVSPLQLNVYAGCGGFRGD